MGEWDKIFEISSWVKILQRTLGKKTRQTKTQPIAKPDITPRIHIDQTRDPST